MNEKTKMEAISNVVFNFVDFRCDIGWLFIITKFITIFNDAENDFFFHSSPSDAMKHTICTYCKHGWVEGSERGFICTWCMHSMSDRYKSQTPFIWCRPEHRTPYKRCREREKIMEDCLKNRLKNTPSQIIIIHFTLWRLERTNKKKTHTTQPLMWMGIDYTFRTVVKCRFRSFFQPSLPLRNCIPGNRFSLQWIYISVIFEYYF